VKGRRSCARRGRVRGSKGMGHRACPTWRRKKSCVCIPRSQGRGKRKGEPCVCIPRLPPAASDARGVGPDGALVQGDGGGPDSDLVQGCGGSHNALVAAVATALMAAVATALMAAVATTLDSSRPWPRSGVQGGDRGMGLRGIAGSGRVSCGSEGRMCLLRIGGEWGAVEKG
jgi:hypothetical protein